MKRVLYPAIAVIACAYGLWSWAPWEKSQAPAAANATAVEVAEVRVESLDVTIESVGTLKANESVTLRPEVAGRITDITFEEGSPVKKGEVLFKIDDRMAAAELKQAEANLRLANLEYTRFAKLSKTGAATRRLFDQAQASLGVAQANVDLARAKLDYATIRAPFDGVVGLRNVSPGDYVNTGQDLANFVSYNPMKVDFTIPETRADALQAGQTLEMTVEALPNKSFAGEVYALDPQVDVNGRALALRARVANPDNTLKPGYFARVSLVVAKKDAALIVPEGAIVPQGDKTFSYVLRGDDTVTMVPVTIGERLSGGRVEITEGLAAGDRVVTSGQIKLREGATVKIADPAIESGAESADEE